MTTGLSPRAARKKMALSGQKPCLGCGEIKLLSEFHIQKTGVGGRTSRCIVCENARVLSNRNANKLHANAQGREWYMRNKEKRTLSIKKYHQTQNGKSMRRASSAKFRRNNPEKVFAHDAVRKAIQRGIIQKPNTCTQCGIKKNLQAHHDYYSKPLDVIWLCVPCHVQLHIDRGDR